MTLGIVSGFAILALASGFFLLKKKPVENSASSDAVVNDSLVTSEELKEIIGIESSYVDSPADILLNSSITSSPFSPEWPDYTGASYVGDDWYLMANGLYFNKKYKTWQSEPPKRDDKTGAVVGTGVTTGAILGTTVDTVGTVIQTQAKIAWIIAGLSGAVGFYILDKKNVKRGK